MDVELSDTLNKSWKENKSNFGYRMLAKMGWSEDKGKSGVVCVCMHVEKTQCSSLCQFAQDLVRTKQVSRTISRSTRGRLTLALIDTVHTLQPIDQSV